MDPILRDKLLGIGTPYSGTNMERNELIGVIRQMIKENKYTVDYILDYCQSLGYQYQMASDIFQELTGMNPKVIVNNNEYYQNPNFVPAMTLAWGYKKSSKTEAYYVVPFEYGYSVMFKNEKDTPESQFQFISIDEAVDKLKSLVTKVFTINKIITDNCLDKEDIQLNSNTVHNVNNPYFSTPINEMKQAYINKVIDESQFEKKAFQLVAEEKITVKEADDAMKWLDELKKERTEEELEDVEFGNIKNDEKMDLQEENKQLSGSNNFDEVYEEVETSIGDEYADKNKLRMIYFKNKSFLKNLSKEEAAQKLYELYLGFRQEDIKDKDKYIKKNKIKANLPNFSVTIRRNVDDEVIDIQKYDNEQDAKECYNNMLSNIDDDCYVTINKLSDNNEYEEIKNSSLIKKSSLKKKAGYSNNPNYFGDWFGKGQIDFSKIINPNDSGDVWMIKIWCGSGYIMDVYLVKANDNIDAIDKVFEWSYENEGHNKIIFDREYLENEAKQYFKEEPDMFNDPTMNEEEFIDRYLEDGLISNSDYSLFSRDDSFFVNKVPNEYLNKSQASLKKKAADADIELDDIEEKDVMKDKIEEINNTDFEELTKEETPQDYLEDESKNEQVMKINEKVGKIIDEFTSKFKDFTKYELQMSSYKLQVLNQGSSDTSLQPIEDTELNAQAILQIILTIAPTEDLENTKKALAIFCINKDKVLFNGTLRMEGNTFVAFSEEGLDSIFTNDKDKVDITDELI